MSNDIPTYSVRNLHRIREASQLRELLTWQLMPSRRRHRVQIEADGISEKTKQLWQAELSHLRNVCGCEQGALGLAVGVLGYLGYLFIRSGGWPHFGKAEIWTGIVAIVVTTSCGKLIGIMRAKRRMRLLIAEIRHQWEQTDAGKRPDDIQGTGRIWPSRCCGNASSLPAKSTDARSALNTQAVTAPLNSELL